MDPDGRPDSILGAAVHKRSCWNNFRQHPLYCTAWRFQFPSYIEQLLWRISAISITGGPFLMVFFMTLGLRENASDWGSSLCMIAFILVLILYIVAQLALLVVSFMTLRSLPRRILRNGLGSFHTPLRLICYTVIYI
jgi:hypothetical protein